MSHQPFHAPGTIRVECLYSLYYFEFACGYVFAGEQHDFWEMVYIDRGEAEIGAGADRHRLTQGEAFFHQPNEFHTIWANAAQGTNIFVISFGCHSPAMQRFIGRRETLTDHQRRLISRIIRQGQRAFGPVMDKRPENRLILAPDAPVESAQLIEVYLTQLLLELIPQHEETPPLRLRVTEEDFGPVAERITQMMLAAPDGSLRFEDVCRETGLSATVLKSRFKRFTGTTVMAYYQRLRLEESRRMLRQGGRNISQVAQALGYSSPQAFARQFRRVMGLSPLDYLKMVKT